ncbi:autotransporter subunit C, partial [Thalassolituus marinus]|nr:autotransporter subunit C [Thalassolituus marinus]
CVTDTTLYAGWGDAVYIDAEGNTQSYWKFGTNSQLPALNLNGTLYRDSDGDGAVDSDDLWPDNRAAAYDRDGDGYPDRWSANCDAQCRVTSGLALDKFPDNAAAWQDDDNDGQPESWDNNCDSSCQQASGLLFDLYPDDFDNDGLNTLQDPDDNNDGIEDADADSDGLIDVSTLTELNAIRYSLNGQGQRLSDSADIDSSGCPEQIVNGLPQPRCRGYELTADLDFDTNGDGQITELDDWWNNGEGWLPIGSYSNPFIATFDGRGHQIRNLWINRPGSNYSGLFASVREARL